MSKKEELLNMSDSALNEAVKVAGTDYDRRRKVTKDMVYRMNRMVESGNKTLSEIGAHYGVSASTVKYNTNAAFKKAENLRRAQYAPSDSVCDPHELAEYKRTLIEQGKRLPVMG